MNTTFPVISDVTSLSPTLGVVNQSNQVLTILYWDQASINWDATGLHWDGPNPDAPPIIFDSFGLSPVIQQNV